MAENQRHHIVTEDGSSTFFSEKYGDHYHSTHGSIQESRHVFIEIGLKHWKDSFPRKNAVRILEVGLGTGLNCFLTFLEKGDLNVRYSVLEPEPLELDQTKNINFCQCLGLSSEEVLEGIHSSVWEEEVLLGEKFGLMKTKARLQEFETEEKFDLIYFDAFGPQYQSELWEEEIFQKVFGLCAPGAVFVTYCAKGSVRRAMQASGFEVERLPGPPGKREMLRGRKR